MNTDVNNYMFGSILSLSSADLRLSLILSAAVLALWLIFAGELTAVGQTILLLAAMPAGSCCAMFTRQYGGDWGLATRCVMLSTLCAVETVPLWLLVTIL